MLSDQFFECPVFEWVLLNLELKLLTDIPINPSKSCHFPNVFSHSLKESTKYRLTFQKNQKLNIQCVIFFIFCLHQWYRRIAMITFLNKYKTHYNVTKKLCSVWIFLSYLKISIRMTSDKRSYCRFMFININFIDMKDVICNCKMCPL